MKLEKIEALTEALRRYDFSLDLTTTVIPNVAKYSAIFWARGDKRCQECEGYILADWDECQHASTIIEVIWLAAEDCITKNGINIDLRRF